MRQHVIIATDLVPDIAPAQIHYFAGYLDQGRSFEPIWTRDPWRACQLDEAEVGVELTLLAGICPGTFLKSWSLDVIASRKAS